MAKQLNLLTPAQVIPTALHIEMQRSYLEYAMSVIVGRALPDARDGLKPVHRRIVYAMHELGLTPDRPFRKCARVVGDVLGKYHPHGDQAVYDALVRMVQEFSSRYPLLAGHGNFGSVDDDPPAAMRYTETRLAAIAHEAILAEIGDATVDFIGNFDNSQQEPTVLPAQLPLLLLNGSSGIAVGMATNIPPHNLGEVVDGLMALIDRPDLSDQDLLKLIPGPDFPTGGEIVSTDGIREAYTTGRGSIPVRGVVQVEEVQPGRGRHRRAALVVTELPYQVNKAAWIEKVADLVNQGRLEGVADIRDESDRDGMRVVIELKREIQPAALLNELYRQTALQSNFGAILLALAEGQPRQMPLRELLQIFLQFREQTLSRRYNHELDKSEQRRHLLAGMLAALTNLDGLIEILRQAPDGTTAKTRLQEQFQLSDRQSDAILAMPLRRLTGLERQNLQTEFEELTQRTTELQRLLGDRRELLKALKKDLRSLKRKYGDRRRTRILGQADPAGGQGAMVKDPPPAMTPPPRSHTPQRPSESSEPPSLQEYTPEPEATVVELTQRGYIRRLTPKAFQRQQRPRTSLPAPEDCEDAVIQAQPADTAQELLVLTRSGKAYTLPVEEIPSGRNGRGTPLISLLPTAAQGDPEAIVQTLVLPGALEGLDLLLLSHQGRIKRIPLLEFTHLTGRGLIGMKLKPGDTLIHASLVQPATQLVLATSSGRLLRFEVNLDQLPVMGRTTQGLAAMRLGSQEQLVGWAMVDPQVNLLLVSQQGYLQALPLQRLRLGKRGELGTQVMQFANRTDELAGFLPLLPEAGVLLQTTTQRLIRLPPESLFPEGVEIDPLGLHYVGDRLIQADQGERILAVIPLIPHR
ncbi:DNA topoisomerase IV subunit A [Neosynechococcus sphagnicola sy1]|uniref:DNA topoisomerase (ATP-hydrolyzing) n=1 Tax=Neosynechococcus sphagnicola sy1 TaxID=1497020 RepID=A0A098TPV8_9CYAN|nr:DNA topoisomerase (ATP-hydrolyzing) [Neosynechococcus sphagnicola]KGF73912.1 DNA topoisomerase IV subunit A [Neosynechococcus sphagnicola sy1]